MPDEANELVELRQLRDIVKGFVDKQQITCAESVYQCDRVIDNAYEFIKKCCDVVGYYKDPDLVDSKVEITLQVSSHLDNLKCEKTKEKEPEPECECKGGEHHDPHCPLSEDN